ncbi:MAG TPA: hypothetical protein VIY26_06450 [Acidimicrobiales bacterium]
MGASPVAPGDAAAGTTFSRRQALGRAGVLATAGAAAWVVPEILTAKPAAGATLSGGTNGGAGGSTSNPTTNPASTGGTGGTGSTPATLTSSTAPAGGGSSLAMTGLNIQRDAEIGAALIAGGWAMHHWASRGMPKAAAEGATEAHEAGSPDEAI